MTFIDTQYQYIIAIYVKYVDLISSLFTFLNDFSYILFIYRPNRFLIALSIFKILYLHFSLTFSNLLLELSSLFLEEIDILENDIDFFSKYQIVHSIKKKIFLVEVSQKIKVAKLKRKKYT